MFSQTEKRIANAEAARRYRANHPGRQAEIDARYYANNAEIAKARSKAFVLKDRRPGMLYQAKKRAKAKGFEFNLTLDNVVWPEVCPVFGTPFIYEGAKGSAQDTSPSLDRVDSSKGYVTGNVQVISWLANRIKNDATPEQLMRVALYMNGRWPNEPGVPKIT